MQAAALDARALANLRRIRLIDELEYLGVPSAWVHDGSLEYLERLRLLTLDWLMSCHEHRLAP